MNSHHWSESLLHRFRGKRVVDSALSSSDDIISSTHPNTTTTDSDKVSMSTNDSSRVIPLSIHHQNESLPLMHSDHDDNDDAKDRSSMHRQIVRDVRSRWNRLTTKTRRIVYFCLLPLVVCYLTAAILDSAFPRYGVIPVAVSDDQKVTTLTSLNVAKTNEFVVVINTYQRPKQLQNAVRHYAETCGPAIGISTIYIVWAEEGVTPPTSDSFFQHTKTKRRKRSNIEIRQVRNSLNSRFLPIPNVHDMAIFMVDDDIRVDCVSLQRGYQAWKSYPTSMVGYYPRLSSREKSYDYDLRHIQDPTNKSYIYHSWPTVYWRQEMNFILTKACFLHSHYMSIYSDPNHHPIEIINYIDQYFNCEDVAMSLLVANITKSSETTSHIPARPIYVEGTVRDKGLFNGISTGTGHMKQRSQCLKDLTTIYHQHGWGIPLLHTFSLRESSWRQHRFWWQSQPSNIFEWFAISNIFK